MKYSRHYFMVSLAVLLDAYKGVYGLAKAMEREIRNQMEDDRFCKLERVERYGKIHYELYFDDPQMNWAPEFVMNWQLAIPGRKYRVDAINGCTLGIYK